MESIQNELMKRYAKNKLQELLGGGQASSKQDAQSMVIDMLKEKFGIGHGDAQSVAHEMTGPAEEEMGRNSGGIMGQAASFFGGGDDEKHQRRNEPSEGGIMDQAASMFGGGGRDNRRNESEGGYGRESGNEYGRQEGGGDMFQQAERLAMQALGGGQGTNQIVEMLQSQFGLDHHNARGIVNKQQERLDGAAGGGSGVADRSFADKAEGFLERMTGQ